MTAWLISFSGAAILIVFVVAVVARDRSLGKAGPTTRELIKYSGVILLAALLMAIAFSLRSQWPGFELLPLLLVAAISLMAWWHSRRP